MASYKFPVSFQNKVKTIKNEEQLSLQITICILFWNTINNLRVYFETEHIAILRFNLLEK
jgi:hypothetical protein